MKNVKFKIILMATLVVSSFTFASCNSSMYKQSVSQSDDLYSVHNIELISAKEETLRAKEIALQEREKAFKAQVAQEMAEERAREALADAKQHELELKNAVARMKSNKSLDAIEQLSEDIDFDSDDLSLDLDSDDVDIDLYSDDIEDEIESKYERKFNVFISLSYTIPNSYVNYGYPYYNNYWGGYYGGHSYYNGWYTDWYNPHRPYWNHYWGWNNYYDPYWGHNNYYPYWGHNNYYPHYSGGEIGRAHV